MVVKAPSPPGTLKVTEIVIYFMDKDSRVVISTPETYKKAAMVHIAKDEEVEWSEVERITTLMNRTSKQIVKMFDVGGEGSDSQKGRIVKGITCKDTDPPPVSFL